MTFTCEDQRDKIRSQLIYEITHPEQQIIKANKLQVGLSKRARFLEKARKQKLEDPNGL
jgi:hypothetical protein